MRKISCPYCGAPINEDTPDCPNCGFHVSANDFEVYIQEQKELLQILDYSGKGGQLRQKQITSKINKFAGPSIFGQRFKSARLRRLVKLIKKLGIYCCDVTLPKGLIPTENNVGFIIHGGRQFLGLGIKTPDGYPYVNKFGEFKFYSNKNRVDEFGAGFAMARLAYVLDQSFNSIESKFDFFLKESKKKFEQM